MGKKPPVRGSQRGSQAGVVTSGALDLPHLPQENGTVVGLDAGAWHHPAQAVTDLAGRRAFYSSEMPGARDEGASSDLRRVASILPYWEEVHSEGNYD